MAHLHRVPQCYNYKLDIFEKECPHCVEWGGPQRKFSDSTTALIELETPINQYCSYCTILGEDTTKMLSNFVFLSWYYQGNIVKLKIKQIN